MKNKNQPSLLLLIRTYITDGIVLHLNKKLMVNFMVLLDDCFELNILKQLNTMHLEKYGIYLLKLEFSL